MRLVPPLVLVAVACSWAKPHPKVDAGRKSAKVQRSATSGKVAGAARISPKSPEAICTDAWRKGDLAALRRKCLQEDKLGPSGALYWKSLLATDPSVLRRTLSAVHLKSLDSLDSRLLLLAGRYQFSVGEARELNDLAWLAAKRKLKDARIDTLRKLAKGG